MLLITLLQTNNLSLGVNDVQKMNAAQNAKHFAKGFS